MKRRDFLLASAGAAATTAVAAHVQAQTASAGRDYYEWRTYRLASADQQTRLGDYLQHAALPAWKRLGLGPVGVFTEIGADAGPSMHVLLVYPTLETFAAARTALEADAEYLKAADAYLKLPLNSPGFQRIESTLLVAFAGAPKLTAPQPKPRVFEMRTYESHTEERARKKVEMFNSGEIPIFPHCGFENVFFGEALVGSTLPCLKYMLAAPDMAANEAGWKKFLADPGFTALKNDPQYADTVSKITKLFLEPTSYSQV